MTTAPVVVAKQSQRSETKNTPGEIRTAYPFFHKKREKNAAKKPYLKKDGSPNPRYSGTFMFPKTVLPDGTLATEATCPNYLWLWGLGIEAAMKMWPGSVDGNGNWAVPPGMQYSVQNGDVPYKSKPKPGMPIKSDAEIAKANEWRKGYWIVEAERFLDPGPRIAKVINGVIAELPADTINGVLQYKGGDWGFGSFQAYAYENETFGVNFGFDGFLFTRPGDAIGNSQSGPPPASQMFGSVAALAAAAAPASAVPLPGAVSVAPAAPVAAPAGLPPLPGAVAAPVAPAASPVAPAAPVAPPALPGGLPPIPTR